MRNLQVMLLIIALAGAWALALPALSKEEPPRPKISLQTPYMTQTIRGAHRLTCVGVLGGRGKLTLDPNTCAVDAFGDPTACTEIAPRSIDVEMRQAKLADPSGKGRRLYRLVGALPRGEAYYLVIPKRRSEAHRLIVESAKNLRHVITLEPRPVIVPTPKPKAAPLCKHATYKAERKGSRIVITAAGEHPSLGYKTHFEKLPLRIFPPQFRLVCKPPEGMAATMMSPFSVETSFDAGGTTVREVVVHDTRGRHKVAVP